MKLVNIFINKTNPVIDVVKISNIHNILFIIFLIIKIGYAGRCPNIAFIPFYDTRKKGLYL